MKSLLCLLFRHHYKLDMDINIVDQVIHTKQICRNCGALGSMTTTDGIPIILRDDNGVKQIIPSIDDIKAMFSA